MEQRVVIGFLTLKGFNSEEIYSELESIYREDLLTHPTVYKCHERFRDWRTELSDDPRSEKPRKSNLAEAISPML
jgi:transposase